jgi:predicted RNA binding protein with dsRBD fold (UPF0201 family)
LDEVEVHIEADVNPTEDLQKVETAVKNIFENVDFTVKNRGRTLLAEAKGMDSLRSFGNLLRRERIRSASRRVLFKGLNGKTITFYLNKQVAYVGHVSFSNPVAESPLGPIKVQIRCDKPHALIEFLAPKT